MRGQGYDGAANMAEAVNGCAAIICRTYPKALYLLCSAHALTLCVVAASKSIFVTSMWALLKEISLFISSSLKRQDKLIEVIKSHESNEVKVKKLVDLCRTRWVARHTALVTFQALYSAVVDTLGQISQAPRSQ